MNSNPTNVPTVEIRLNFNGYYTNVKALPNNINGVYLIYTYDETDNPNKISVKELIYIGKADSQSIQERVGEHPDEEFEDYLDDSDGLCYSFAEVDRRQIDIVENALIAMQQPPCNTYLKDSYNHKAAEIISDGNCTLLNYNDFAIRKDGDDFIIIIDD